jgi:hypothetical protein
LARGLCRNEIDFKDDIFKVAELGMKKLFDEALEVSTSVKRDFTSSRMCVVHFPQSNHLPASDLVEQQWPVANGPTAQRVLGTYSLGLVKYDEFDHRTVLLRPRVVTDQVLHLSRGENAKSPQHGAVRQQQAPGKPLKSAEKKV